MAGAHQGNNTIVAAGSIIAGKTYPSDVILAGVPAKVIGKTSEWAEKHYIMNDYIGAENEQDGE